VGENNENRLLMVSGYVDDEMTKDVVRKILEWNMEDDRREDEKSFDRTKHPIRMIVNSSGGVVQDGFGIVSTIKGSQTPVIALCLGRAYSMGLLIFTAAHKRMADSLSTFMYHELAFGMDGKLQEFKESIEWKQTMMDMYDREILTRTKITQERLDEAKKDKDNWFMTADDALKYGVVDEIFSDNR
jgi:ATP-dependent Clp protease protease subunit